MKILLIIAGLLLIIFVFTIKREEKPLLEKIQSINKANITVANGGTGIEIRICSKCKREMQPHEKEFKMRIHHAVWGGEATSITYRFCHSCYMRALLELVKEIEDKETK